MVRRTHARVSCAPSPPYILMRTPVASFSCRNSIPTFRLIVLPLTITLIEVLSGAAMLLSVGRSIEVIKHQVHVCLLLPLQMILYRLVSMNLNLNMCVRLPRYRTGLVKHSSVFLVLVWQNFPRKLPLLIRFQFLLIAHIECPPTEVTCGRGLSLLHLLMLSSLFVIADILLDS